MRDSERKFVSCVPVEMLVELPEYRAMNVLSDLMHRHIPYRTEYECGLVRVFINRELESVIALLEVVAKYFVDEF